MLVTPRDIRDRLGVTTRQVWAWIDRGTGGFPPPVKMTERAPYPGAATRTPLFEWEAVEAWYAGYRPHRGTRTVEREHGTARGYHQHRYRGERPCEPCLAARRKS